MRVHITGGRQLQDCNHEVELVPAHKVTPYAQGIKNDINNSITVAEAISCPGVSRVAVKTVEQQNLKLHSLKQQAVHQRTQKRNALRTHLLKHGSGHP